MKTNITVNLADGREFDVPSEVVDFSDLRGALNDALFTQAVSPDDWTSVVVVIVNPAAKPQPDEVG